ncbi:response regulator receiver protein [Marinobacter lipolyticus SM19]|uniref:Response regulator receiver protein n=1 Tax=Marinobacter lipolyticus SM19 TaxID=1318628 RepID=R8B529_9GAMM|nr:response regulator [Marinobacter lipolyticus]EON93609.1 response regulator receiver protein [Marinobacter lipolyticus SM19]
MSTQPLRILLVEDNPNDLELTMHALSASKLSNPVVVARDGAEALEQLFGKEGQATPPEPPQLILLDLKLPKVDGLEVLERIKGDARTRTIPVVVLTSSSEGPDIDRAYRLGVNSYIVKPVDFGQFCNTVKQLGMYWLLLNQPV